MARAVSRPRSLHAPEPTRSADASRTEISARVETPRVESARIEPVKVEDRPEPKAEATSELRRSTD
jgi:hypothetical protein